MRGQKPTPCIFPDDFLQEARDAAGRRTISVRDAQRFHLVRLIHEQPAMTHLDAAAAPVCPPDKSNGGDNAGPPAPSTSATVADAAARPVFPPLDYAWVKALACQSVSETGEPLSRQSLADLARRVAERIGRPMSRSTICRILQRDALKPWQHESWIFPCDLDFGPKAARVLDLYAGRWQGRPLRRSDVVLSSDEKTSIPARHRRHPETPPQPGQRRRVEHTYDRKGALQYLAAWDVRGVRRDCWWQICSLRRSFDCGEEIPPLGRNPSCLNRWHPISKRRPKNSLRGFARDPPMSSSTWLDNS